MHHLLVGRIGERHAVRHLRRRGYEILARNYRCPSGEIDIVAREGGVLVFVEVKTRSTAGYGLPEEAVDGRKQRRIVRAARFYLSENREEETPCRFDVVAVHLAGSGRARAVELLRNAFETSAE